MNTKLAISAIALVAVVMGLGLIAPAFAGVNGGAEKVTICHKPNGPDPQTLEVSVNALPAHLAHGDTLSPCNGPE